MTPDERTVLVALKEDIDRAIVGERPPRWGDKELAALSLGLAVLLARDSRFPISRSVERRLQLSRQLHDNVPPQLVWDGPDEDGDFIVQLSTMPRLLAHGPTHNEALARLGEILHMALCNDPECRK